MNKERLVIRLTNEYLLNFVAILRDLFDQDVTKGLVFIAFVQGNVGHLDQAPPEGDRFDQLDNVPSAAQTRPMRPHKIALSLGLARETVRRKALALTGEGSLVAFGEGLTASLEFATSDRLRAAVLANTVQIERLCALLAAAGVGGAKAVPTKLDRSHDPHRAIARISVSYVLRCMDEVRCLFEGDILSGLIFCAIVDANISHLIGQPGDPFAGLDDHVPDELRRPISALALASRLGLPRETARRHVRKLEAAGVCQSTQAGLIVPQATLRRSEIVEATIRNGRNVRLLLRQLSEAGFPRGREAAAGDWPVARASS